MSAKYRASARADASRKEIKKLVEALLARDEEAAARACVEHVENTAAAVFQALDKSDIATG